MAGVQAGILSVLCVMVPAVAAFTATSAADVNTGVSWFDAAREAADLWALGHGGHLATGAGQTAATVTLAPLGIAVVGALACRFLARVSSVRGWWLVAFGALGYVAVAALTMFAMATPASRPSAPVGVVGAAILAIVGFVWGNAPTRSNGATPRALVPRLTAWARATLPDWLRAVPRAGLVAAATTLGGASVLTVVWAVIGHGRFADATTALDAGLVGGVVLALLSAAFTPNLVIYAVAYLAGTGFSVGAGALYSPAQTTPGPLPALPLLGLLPDSAHAGAIWLVSVPVAAGALAGLSLRRRLPARTPWWTMAFSAILASLASAGGLALLVAAASGAAGPGRMAVVGADPSTVLLALGLEFAGGCVPVAVLARARIANRVWDATHPNRPIRVKGRGPGLPLPPPEIEL
jgi:hypothetical protein